MAPVDLLGSTFEILLRSADTGWKSSSWMLDRFSRSRRPRIRERLAVETVQYGLVRLYDFVEHLEQTSDEDLDIVSRRLVVPLQQLATVTNAHDLLIYGDSAFEAVRYHPKSKGFLEVPLRWHDRFAVEAGLRQEGAPYELPRELAARMIPLSPILQVRRASVNLLGRLASRLEPASGDADSDGFGGDGPPPVDISPDDQPPVVPLQKPEPARYTDLALYDGRRFRSDLKKATRLSDDQPLISGRLYTLEVAIRLKRLGIEADRRAPPADNPRVGQEDVRVWVRAISLSDSITIAEPFAKIAWPFNKDSDSAVFSVTANAPVDEDHPQPRIQVRLYDKSLDLLDVVELSVSVVARAGAGPTRAQHLEWPGRVPRRPRIDPATPVRKLSINVSTRDQGYELDFIFVRDGQDDLKIPGPVRIPGGDLEPLLKRVRNFWTDLAITNYATDLSVTHFTFEKRLIALREIGMQAWQRIFGMRGPAVAGASEAVGDLLKEMAPADGMRIQVTCAPGVVDFIFPWSILHPVIADDSVPVDPFQFWGARYQIEQVEDGPEDDALDEEPVEVVFSRDPGFGNADAQETLLEAYKTKSDGRLNVTRPIDTAQTLFDALLSAKPAHLFYFYCHGYTASAHAGDHSGTDLIKTMIEAFPPTSRIRADLDTLLDRVKAMKDESWIFVGGSEITENKLAQQEFFAGARRPLVFLNMCESAELLPSMSSGLVRVFLKKNAAAVIGTECPMTPIFANAFSEAVFDRLFAGRDVGTALWEARRTFLDASHRNPLGLAYTLYGRSTSRLGKGPLIPSSTHE